MCLCVCLFVCLSAVKLQKYWSEVDRTLVRMFVMVNCTSDQILATFFAKKYETFLQILTNINTMQHGCRYEQPRTRRKFGEHAFTFAGPMHWNTLPQHLQTLTNTLTFKHHLKTFLFQQAYDV